MEVVALLKAINARPVEIEPAAKSFTARASERTWKPIMDRSSRGAPID